MLQPSSRRETPLRGRVSGNIREAELSLTPVFRGGFLTAGRLRCLPAPLERGLQGKGRQGLELLFGGTLGMMEEKLSRGWVGSCADLGQIWLIWPPGAVLLFSVRWVCRKPPAWSAREGLCFPSPRAWCKEKIAMF